MEVEPGNVRDFGYVVKHDGCLTTSRTCHLCHRWVVVQAAWQLVKRSPRWKAIYERLKVRIGGQTLCGALRAFIKAVHLLSAVDHKTHCVLSQLRVDEKTNGHKAALELLQELVVKGKVIVGDAMFCPRDLCQQVLDAGGDYLIAVKENQPGILREIQLEFNAAPAAFSLLRPA